MKRIIIFLTCALFTLATGMLYAAGKGDGGGRGDNWNRQSLEDSTRGAERAEQRRADDRGMTSQQLMEREQQREREREREQEQAKSKGQGGKGSMQQEQEREREREREHAQPQGQGGKGSMNQEQEQEREREREKARERSGKKTE